MDDNDPDYWPEAERKMLDELMPLSRTYAALTAADALADAVEETTAAISEYYPSDEPDIVGTFELREALRAYRAARGR